MPQLNFDATKVEPQRPIEPLPSGEYPMVFVDSEMKENKKGNGSYLQLVAEVIDGEYKGRKVWERLNLDNPNQQAVQIAQSTLSAICHAVNVMRPQDSVELHNKPFVGVVKYVPETAQYKAGNEFSGYKPISGSAPNANPTPVMTPTQKAAQQAASTAPAQSNGQGERAAFWK